MACAGCGYRFRVIQGRIVGERSSGQTQSPKRAADATSSGSVTNWAMMVGVMTTVTVAFFMGYFERGVEASLISASLAGVASGAWLKWQMTPAVPVRYLTPDMRATFATAEQLRQAKGKLMQSRNGHAAALKGKQDLRRRLIGLREKMEDLALTAYGPRIASIDAALITLGKQIDMDTRLRDGYDKSIKMIEIELEAGVAADQMNEDITAAIAAAMSELQALEESQAELGRQLEANVEVEQLLRPRAG